MLSKWKVRKRAISTKEFYEVFKVIPQTEDIITRGGLWETEAEAQKLADNLNGEEGK